MTWKTLHHFFKREFCSNPLTCIAASGNNPLSNWGQSPALLLAHAGDKMRALTPRGAEHALCPEHSKVLLSLTLKARDPRNASR